MESQIMPVTHEMRLAHYDVIANGQRKESDASLWIGIAGLSLIFCYILLLIRENNNECRRHGDVVACLAC